MMKWDFFVIWILGTIFLICFTRDISLKNRLLMAPAWPLFALLLTLVAVRDAYEEIEAKRIALGATDLKETP